MQQPSRIALLDSLRGYALLGLFLVHSVEMFELYWANPLPGPVFDWTFGIFAGKSFALFALCFGISFYIIMERAAQRGVDFTGRFVWRLTILFGFGLLHTIFYRGDILEVLAAVGLVMIPFNRIKSSRTLLIWAAIFLIQLPLMIRAWFALQGSELANHPALFTIDQSMPVMTGGTFGELIAANAGAGHIQKWSFYLETGRVVEIAGLFLVGIVLGRSGFFADPDRFVAKRRTWLLVAALTWLAIYFARDPLLAAIPRSDTQPMGRQNISWMLDTWSALAAMAFQVVIFVELYQSIARRLLNLLAPVGRMTLTLYIGQSLVFVPIFYGFGLAIYDDISQEQAITLGIVAFILQIIFAHLWYRKFLYGPLEWLWRALTRMTAAIPFVRREPAPAATPA